MEVMGSDNGDKVVVTVRWGISGENHGGHVHNSTK